MTANFSEPKSTACAAYLSVVRQKGLKENKIMRVPNWEKAVVDKSKLQGYLLSPTHPVGQFKARYFAALGYDATDWEVLEADLIATLDSDAADTISSEFGAKFTIQGSIIGPIGRQATVTTVWIILSNEEAPRFVTAYPEN